MKIENLEINKVRVIESLRDNDVKTGEEIETHIRQISNVTDSTYLVKKTKNEFLGALDTIYDDAEPSDGIMLFLEVHGSKFGIEVNGELIQWSELNQYFLKINEKIGLGLVIVFSCCFGAYYYKQTTLKVASPYFVMFGVDEKVYPDDLLFVNKSIVNGLNSHQELTDIKSSINDDLIDKNISLVCLNAHDLFVGSFKKYVLTVLDQVALENNFLANIYPQHKLDCGCQSLNYSDAKKLYFDSVLSISSIESKFNELRERFLLTDKFFDADIRFSTYWDDICDELDAENKLNSMREQLT
ncbi:hypothetical protein ACJO1Z_23140 [Vibrio parahaemolyticus]|uniref:hypothetical protein n=1 Tax=Vibrio parahaemolyticus TaxID=670 RepID=UPI001E0F5D7D|nr:hypothetical protein [Vibrio parahaemolyticus]